MTKEIKFISDHVEDGIGTLIEQFKGKVDFENYLKPFLNQCQQIEEMFAGLYLLRNIEDGIGKQLDGLGTILGLARNGLNDEDYRSALKFQAFLNASKGEPELLISALKVFTKSEKVAIYELYPAKIYGYYQGEVNILTNDKPFSFESEDISDGGFAIVDASNNLIDDGDAGMFVIWNYYIDQKLTSLMDSLCMGGVKWLGSIIDDGQPFILNEGYFKEGSSELFGGFAIVDASNNLIDDGESGHLTIFN